MQDRISFGVRLRNLRDANNLTLEQLSLKTKVSLPYLCEMEGDKTNPSLSMVRKISDSYGLMLSELFLGVE